jgi:hypothetical protein
VSFFRELIECVTCAESRDLVSASGLETPVDRNRGPPAPHTIDDISACAAHAALRSHPRNTNSKEKSQDG